MASNRVFLDEIPHDLYEALRAIDGNEHVRMAYNGRGLELFEPSREHVVAQFRLGLFVELVARVLELPCVRLRQTTLADRRVGKAKDVDGCFALGDARRSPDESSGLTAAPPPDLVLEVELDRAYLNSLDVFEAIEVPEVWRYDGNSLRIHQLGANGGYVESARSRAIPCLWDKDITRWMARAEATASDTIWMTQVVEWARIEIVPRLALGD